MKYTSPILACVAAISCFASPQLIFAQNDALGVKPAYHALVTPSTLCVVRLTADSINSPAGLFETPDFAPFVAAMQEYSHSQDVFVVLGTPEARRAPSANVCVKQLGRSIDEVTAAMKSHGFGRVESSGDYFVMPLFLTKGPPPTQVQWQDDSKRFAELDAALEEVKDQPVQIAVLPPRHLWRTYREVQPMLPEELGGGPSSLLTDGIVWAAIGIDPADLATNLHIQSASEAAAADLAAAVPGLVASLAAVLPGEPAGGLAGLLAVSKQHVSANGSAVVGSISIGGEGPQVAEEALRRILAPVGTRRKSGQLKEMMLAIHNYESAYKYLPPGPKARGEDGKPWLSWRVHILPFLGEEGVALWREFHLDEPWDSEHNMTLLEKMPDIYAVPKGLLASQQTRPGYTTFQAPYADNTIMGQPKAIRFGDMTDGSSNTIAIVEVKHEFAVPWTAPQDYEFDESNPGAGLFVEADGMFSCAFADGSSHRLPANLLAKTIRDLFGMNDGQVTDVP